MPDGGVRRGGDVGRAEPLPDLLARFGFIHRVIERGDELGEFLAFVRADREANLA